MEGLSAVIPKGPLSVGFDVTNRCNLRCKHCYAMAGEMITAELSTEEIKRIVDELHSLGTLMIGISGGEALTRPDIYDLLKYINSKKIHIMLNSNGTLITDDVARNLKEAGVNQVEISIDGLKETHDYLRGKGSFDLALKGFDACRRNGVRVGIMTTITKKNFGESKQLIDFFEKKGAIGIGFQRFKPIGRGADIKELELSPEERKEFIKSVYDEKVKPRKDFNIKVETPLSLLIAMEYPEITKAYGYAFKLPRGCPGGIVTCNIRPNGDVSSCSQMKLVAGNLRKSSMKEIWDNSPLFAVLRDRGNLKGNCSRCKHKMSCGGCRSCAYLYTGDPMGEDKGCWLKN